MTSHPTATGSTVAGPTDIGDPAETAAPAETGTAVYVRRGRTPALGLWVVLALALGAVLGLVVGAVTGVNYLAGLAYFALCGAMFIGLPLAAIAALLDAIRARRLTARR